MEEVGISDLPSEIIGEIINRGLTVKDFVNFGQVSKRMQKIIESTNYLQETEYETVKNIKKKERFKLLAIDYVEGCEAVKLENFQPWKLYIGPQRAQDPHKDRKFLIPESVTNLFAAEVIIDIDPIRNSKLIFVDLYDVTMIGKLPKSIKNLQIDTMNYEFESLSNVTNFGLWKADYRHSIEIIETMTSLKELMITIDCNIYADEIFCLPHLPSIKGVSLYFCYGNNIIIDLKNNKALERLSITLSCYTKIQNPPPNLEEYIIRYDNNPIFSGILNKDKPKWNKSLNLSARKVVIDYHEHVDYLPDERVKKLIIRTP